MMHRTDKPHHPWELPGGKKRPGETDDAAITREILEELGMHVLQAYKIGETVYRKRWHSHGYHSTWHILDVGDQRPIIREPHLFDRIGSLAVDDLVSIDGVPRGLSPNLLRLREAVMAGDVQLSGEPATNQAA